MGFTVETASCDRRQQTFSGIFTGETERYFVHMPVLLFPAAM